MEGRQSADDATQAEEERGSTSGTLSPAQRAYLVRQTAVHARIYMDEIDTVTAGAPLPRAPPPETPPLVVQASASEGLPPPPAWGVQHSSSTRLPRLARRPFSGGYRGVSWNARGLAAYEPSKQLPKRQVLMRLALHHDFLCI